MIILYHFSWTFKGSFHHLLPVPFALFLGKDSLCGLPCEIVFTRWFISIVLCGCFRPVAAPLTVFGHIAASTVALFRGTDLCFACVASPSLVPTSHLLMFLRWSCLWSLSLSRQLCNDRFAYGMFDSLQGSQVSSHSASACSWDLCPPPGLCHLFSPASLLPGAVVS